MAGQLYKYGPAGQTVVGSIGKSVARVARDAGWRGYAAKRFCNAWETEAVKAAKLAALETSVANILDDLAVRISWISHAYDRKATAHYHGEPVDLDEELKNSQHQVNEAERLAANHLKDLYVGKNQSSSLKSILGAFATDLDLPHQMRAKLGTEINRIEKDLKDDLPDPRPREPEEGLFEDMKEGAEKGTVYGSIGGLAVGGAVGALGLVGGPAAAVTIPGGMAVGTGLGAGLGAAAGAITGAFDHFF
jgi:uncharacterized protein YukE